MAHVRELGAILDAVGGMARFVMDDGYIVGPSEVIFPALEKFAVDIRQTCQLVLERSKTEVFTWNGVLPAEAPEEMKMAGCLVNNSFHPGFLCYGVPVGSDAYVRHMLDKKIDEIAEDAKKSFDTLEEERQALLAILRSSIAQQFDYWCQLCYPSDIKAAAERLDAIEWGVLEVIAGSKIPRGEENNSWSCVPFVPVNKMNGKSYQELLVRQPQRLGGLGLRSKVDVCEVAYVGALEQTIPSFIGQKGICPQLSHLVGDLGDMAARWQPLIQSGCRTGEELQNVWSSITKEMSEGYKFLAEELDDIFNLPVEAVGDGRTDGSTRGLLTEKRETVRARVLKKALENFPDQTARPVLSLPQLDKLSEGSLAFFKS